MHVCVVVNVCVCVCITEYSITDHCQFYTHFSVTSQSETLVKFLFEILSNLLTFHPY